MHMRNHYEGTVLDGRSDVGAESSGSPFRVRPLEWKFQGESYFNERTVGTQQAGWNFVAHLRGHLPPAIGGLLWFGVDDATFSVHVPFHGCTTRVPRAFADGTGDALTWSQDSAFWAFNTVANFVYPRWYIASEVMDRAHATEASYFEALKSEEEKAVALYEKEPAKAAELLTSAAEVRSEKLVRDVFAAFGKLMVTYRDGFKVSSLGPNAPNHGGAQGGVVPKVEERGYTTEWYQRIVSDTGNFYKVPDSDSKLNAAKFRALNKGISRTFVLEGASADVANEALVV
eukprot:gnl/TRDRNA2_/TRDRNA2_162235_c0_seq2.p1 gnl/TRDRNA2_/TRDRNA2_162235_c0~~gnl/TRDRNA2_/TRDRNA2_162235_c0_seq2.p1  ORF type:complete len:287 (-),score=39.31 gnl/TRDRNA2_/TRDRNA2_162235_c0_seq2:109-969(-)